MGFRNVCGVEGGGVVLKIFQCRFSSQGVEDCTIKNKNVLKSYLFNTYLVIGLTGGGDKSNRI